MELVEEGCSFLVSVLRASVTFAVHFVLHTNAMVSCHDEEYIQFFTPDIITIMCASAFSAALTVGKHHESMYFQFPRSSKCLGPMQTGSLPAAVESAALESQEYRNFMRGI